LARFFECQIVVLINIGIVVLHVRQNIFLQQQTNERKREQENNMSDKEERREEGGKTDLSADFVDRFSDCQVG
jgi:hypothetical protein